MDFATIHSSTLQSEGGRSCSTAIGTASGLLVLVQSRRLNNSRFVGPLYIVLRSGAADLNHFLGEPIPLLRCWLLEGCDSLACASASPVDCYRVGSLDFNFLGKNSVFHNPKKVVHFLPGGRCSNQVPKESSNKKKPPEARKGSLDPLFLPDHPMPSP